MLEVEKHIGISPNYDENHSIEGQTVNKFQSFHAFSREPNKKRKKEIVKAKLGRNLSGGDNNRISHQLLGERAAKLVRTRERVVKLQGNRSPPELEFLESEEGVLSLIDGLGAVILVVDDGSDQSLQLPLQLRRLRSHRRIGIEHPRLRHPPIARIRVPLSLVRVKFR